MALFGDDDSPFSQLAGKVMGRLLIEMFSGPDSVPCSPVRNSGFHDVGGNTDSSQSVAQGFSVFLRVVGGNLDNEFAFAVPLLDSRVLGRGRFRTFCRGFGSLPGRHYRFNRLCRFGGRRRPCRRLNHRRHSFSGSVLHRFKRIQTAADYRMATPGEGLVKGQGRFLRPAGGGCRGLALTWRGDLSPLPLNLGGSGVLVGAVAGHMAEGNPAGYHPEDESYPHGPDHEQDENTARLLARTVLTDGFAFTVIKHHYRSPFYIFSGADIPNMVSAFFRVRATHFNRKSLA